MRFSPGSFPSLEICSITAFNSAPNNNTAEEIYRYNKKTMIAPMLPIEERLQIQHTDQRHQEQQEGKQGKEQLKCQCRGVGRQFVIDEISHRAFDHEAKFNAL
jgi:hypothetical protein